MKYTSNGKLDLDEINKKAKSTGFSDRARKYLSSLLLGIHIMGAVPSFGNEVQATEYDFSPQGPKFQEVFDYDMDKINALKNLDIVDEYGERAEINRGNLDEFKDRSTDGLLKKIPESRIVNTFKSFSDITMEKLMEYEKAGVKLVGINNADGTLDLMNCYSPQDLMKIKQKIDKFFGPIKDNDNLSQKEKFIASMEVLRTLVKYDNEAYQPNNPTEYTNAAEYTSRNMYSAMLYGETVCAGYADCVYQICNMMGIDCQKIIRFCRYEGI